ncbi:MAG: hypothetical protein HY591_00120 [Candidatus Omnitrophica bacterium]|nr:hypothetical protein [Candidatus Omnitrophota bacterium]
MSPEFDDPLRLFLGAALGLGLNGFITFFVHLVFGWHAAWAPVVVSLAVLGIVGTRTELKHKIRYMSPQFLPPHWPGLTLLAFIAVFIFFEANYYPLGGWDAWSCWNLKAKFIYLGGDHWNNMFDPVLWRSNTHYPLLLPCINVWFWDLSGQADPRVPMVNGIVFVLLTAGVLLFGLYNFSKQWLLPLAMTAAAFLLPFNITMGASQYSDVVLGLYLLCALVCLMADEFILAGIFLGLLSFTKTEGTVAAVILAGLMMLKKGKGKHLFLTAFVLSALPAILFTLFMAPRNEAFINGLTSMEKPSTLARLQAIAVYPFLELISAKWNGLWLLILGGLAAHWKDMIEGKLQILALFFALYLGALLAYYQVNTFFEINWWLQNTLNRILFALLPAVMFWLGLSLLQKN